MALESGYHELGHSPPLEYTTTILGIVRTKRLPINDTLLKYLFQNDTFWKSSGQKEKGAPNDALLITEAHCFSGEQVSKDRGDMKYNFTPAAQIASLFWDYYTFTGDYDFLRNKAYPFMQKSG